MSRQIKYIVVHCTAGWQDESTKDLIAGFRAQGWKNNGYHYVVSADGKIEQITPDEQIANGVAGHNANSIHISYKGGITKSGSKLLAIDNRTKAQKESLVKKITELKRCYPNAMVLGHRDFSPDKNRNGKIEPNEYIKHCPCFNAIPEYIKL